MAARCARFAATLAGRHGLPVHFIGHSLGGLVIYRMFDTGELAGHGVPTSGSRVVFLGTPAVASGMARQLGATRVGRWLMGTTALAELLDTPQRRWHFEAPLGVIAGNRSRGIGRLLARLQGENDGTVEVAETRIPGASATRVLPVNHAGLLLSKQVAEEVSSFLGTAQFATPR